MHLEIDTAANLLVIEGHRVKGRRRWEAAFVAMLAAPVETDGGNALNAGRFADRLRGLGQHQALNRKQISRVIDSVQAMFAGLGLADELARRLHHAPRARTVGPWMWQHQAGDHLLVLDAGPPAVALSNTLPLPQLAADGSADASAALCRALMVVQGLFREGSPAAAREVLDDTSAWAGASHELQAWHATRLAEALWKLRDFDRAAEVVGLAEGLVARHRLADMFLGDSVGLLRWRLAHQRDPVNAHQTVLSPLLSVLNDCRQVDRLACGLGHNLAALCQRRWLDESAGHPFAQEARARRGAALAHNFAAIFCFATVESPTYTEYACANLGHLFARLYALGHEASPAAAFEWFGLAQAWHFRFDLVDDSVWEYIFMGDLMLYQPGAWSAFKNLGQRIKWDGLRPDTVDFYQLALRRAREIGDPRQLAHAALNLWHFARRTGLSRDAATAGAALADVLHAHPDLHRLLQTEGYPLPSAAETRRASAPAQTVPHEAPHA